MSLYRETLGTSWSITRRYPWLWFFGLFAALVNNAGEYDIVSQNFGFLANLQNTLTSWRDYANSGAISQFFINLGTFLSNDFLNFLLIVVALFLMGAAIVWIIVVSQNALIASAAAAGQKKDRVTFLDGFWTSSSLFRPVFLVNLLAYAVVYVPLLVLGSIPVWLFLNTGSTTALFFASVIAFLFLIPINIVASLLTKYATAYIVVRNYKLKQAITAALALFAKNWLVSLEIAFLIFVINTAVTLVIGLVLIGLGLPLSGLLGYIVFQIFMAFIAAVLATFQYATWTVLFLRLEQGKITAKLVRLFSPSNPNLAQRGKEIRT
jgi:hypothetical protein